MNTLLLVVALSGVGGHRHAHWRHCHARQYYYTYSCCQTGTTACNTCAPVVSGPAAAPEPAHAAPVPYAEEKMVEKPVQPKVEAPAKPKSLYERLGGEPAIKAVVDNFVMRAATDEKVNFTRKGTDKEWMATEENVAKLKKHLVDMVGSVTGGPQKYEGRSMKESHAGMKITAEEFGAIAADLKATLDEFKVPEAEQKELLDIIGSTKGDIVEAE